MRSSEVSERVRFPSSFFLFAGLAALLTAGCSSVSLEKARANFYTGRFARADENLKDIPSGDKDEILYLNERGMIRQNRRRYDESSKDWRQATEINEHLPKYSVSKETASFLTNDRVLTFRGMPFERTLIYTYLAKNYFARNNWDYAAICGRNIIAHLENLDGFPDIPYSRYLAAFCMEMINDPGNAAIQYRAAGKAIPSILIDPDSGQIKPAASNVFTGADSNTFVRAADTREACDLVCFIGIGKMPKWCLSGYDFAMAPYAEIYCEDKSLGRSYPFANTAELMSDSRKRLAVIQAVKETSRIVVKEIISESVESQNQTLGWITRLILFSFEQPDTRCWETLPLWLEIARVPCPASLQSYKVVFKSSSGMALKSKLIEAPISRRGNVFVSFCRDIEEQPPQAIQP